MNFLLQYLEKNIFTDSGLNYFSDILMSYKIKSIRTLINRAFVLSIHMSLIIRVTNPATLPTSQILHNTKLVNLT